MRWRPIDRLVACEAGRSAEAVKRWSPSESFFRDHFPGLPTVPGVLQIEMIAATGGKAIRMLRPDRMILLAAVKSAKFRHRIEPGDECRVHVEITQLRERHAAAEGTIEVGGRTVSQATVLYAITKGRPEEFTDPVLDEWLANHGTETE